MVKRVLRTFEHTPAPHVIESETVDLDNRSFAFTVMGDTDPAVVTVFLGKEGRTMTRAAMKEGLSRILDAIDRVPPIPDERKAR